MNWQVGDLAVCVDGGEFVCAGHFWHLGTSSVPVGTVIRVARIEPVHIKSGSRVGESCGCLNLKNVEDKGGNAKRFRKIRPDEHQACEPEFVKLLKRAKRPVAA